MSLYLVRHASAGHRNGADPTDAERHLDAEGAEHAKLIAKRMRETGVGIIVSSPYPRCVETVEPLAKLLGLGVERDRRLREGADIEESWSVLGELAGVDAVLCSHGDVIPELVSRNQRRGMQVPGRSGCAKASIWELSDWNGTCFTTGTYTKVRD